ncbi:unnamed protein product [Rotaria sp. Silwood1]|nr:unnamed protein product [Rotaria sp. Silwood1]CAF1525674.1 unnamed protein product [Rotaria sp. Silwood1]CAF4842603.1 unnamed protein product [Rotaria sp. Silwood1]
MTEYYDIINIPPEEEYSTEAEDFVEDIENGSSEEDDDDEDEDEDEEDGEEDQVTAEIGRIYYKRPSRNQKMYRQNIIRDTFGVTHFVKVKNIEDSFKKLFTDDVLTTIIEHTNKHIGLNDKFIDEREFLAFIGILYMMGTNQDNVTQTTAPVTLLSYCHKPKEIRIFISNQHQIIGDFEGEKKNSEINIFYNDTKGGVDTIDQLAR